MIFLVDSGSYLEAIKQHLAICPKIMNVTILDERIIPPNHGYFRARLTLTNGDFLEVSEYFISDGIECKPEKYRYQWMDCSQKVLKKRWDNANHFPKLQGCPHHVHVGNENMAIPSESLSIIELIDIIRYNP